MFGLELPPLTPEIFAILGTLVLLEGLLSADNALVLAVMVRPLPKDLQTKALAYGIGGAVVLRILGVLLASYVLQYWWLRAFGALYLAYLTIGHFVKRPEENQEEGAAKARGFWMTVVLLNLTDLAFSVDSILAGVALVPAALPRSQALTIVIIGGIIGLILMRFAATIFLKLLAKYPGLDNTAYALVGWIAVKLGIETVEAASETYGWGWHPHLPSWVFWIVMTAIAVAGTIVAVRKPALSDEEAEKVDDRFEELFEGKAK
ncbi:TerC family protein [Deinococcus yavapaiensis]|uniref:YkoY family integral membrane protein n=1 Tax=Deinococcus yavapaiensis KR-236 TaxID=694435 RepID=A0A318S636_9DEIO|nr:tellurium resistance protein TerC [Deinococcus yavapaiensis]PYE54252.1 YkoY family integral membrane protein [Deinococcus yavapaiensis KR-236]